MGTYAVAPEDELSEGEHLITQLEGREIGVFNIEGEYYAYTNWCAHQAGPICEGNLTGRSTAVFNRETLETDLEYVEEGEILICPWHGWEFNAVTGACLSKKDISLVAHEAYVEDGEIIVSL